MGIYNRDYYRDMSRAGVARFDGFTPGIKYLILLNAAVFVLQLVVVREVPYSPLDDLRQYNPRLYKLLKEKEQQGPEAYDSFKEKHPELFEPDDEIEQLMRPMRKVSPVQEWLELDTDKVMHGEVWRLVTAAFCHHRYSVWHILFNMMFLFWFGRTLEVMYGTREFICFYLMAAVVSSLTFVGLDLYTGSRIPAVGASGAVMAVVMLYTTHFPREIIHLWFIDIEMRWIMLFYLVYDLHPVLLALAGDDFYTGVGHAAHLGGLLFGFLYARYEWRFEDLFARMSRSGGQRLRRPRVRPSLRVYREEPAPETDQDMARVDDLLKKIHEQGEASLSEEERQVLREASARLKKRSAPESP
ncbi:MAG: rhomboid family intramembrane serine protease [Gemmataceae bacterium]